MSGRICKICGDKKDESKFDKHRYTCYRCRYKQYRERLRKKDLLPKKKQKISKEERKKRVKEYQKEYYKNRKKYEKKNPLEKQKRLEKERIYRKEHYKKNKRRLAAKSREYRQKNINKIKTYEKEYRQKNIDKRRKQNQESERRRLERDPSFRIQKRIRNSVYCALIRNQSTKNNLSILKFLPYTMGELKQHIESQFEEWMNWNNWGVYDSKTWDDNDSSTWKWQLDHIIPHSSFNYISMEDKEFLQCWALKNLRPYSAKDNILKGCKIIKEGIK